MKRRNNSRLRAERLRWGFTQAELASLLLIKHATQLSRVERSLRVPSMEAVLASCTVFGRDIEYLFPGIQENIEGRIKKAARKLRTKVEKVHGATAEKKLALLDRIETQDGIPCK